MCKDLGDRCVDICFQYGTCRSIAVYTASLCCSSIIAEGRRWKFPAPAECNADRMQIEMEFSMEMGVSGLLNESHLIHPVAYDAV